MVKRRTALAGAAAVIASGSGTVISQAGAASREIVLGESLPMTGFIASNAHEFREGSRVVFESANANGGVQGKKIRLLVLDDAFDKAAVVENARKLISEQVFCLFGFMGTPGILEVSKYLNEVRMPLVGAVSGSPALKSASHKHVFVVRASFAVEAANAVELGTTIGMRSWGVVFQDDGLGKAALDGVTSSLARQGLKPVVQASFAPSQSPDFKSVLESIRTKEPNALVFGGSAPALAAFVTQAKRQLLKLPPTTVLSVVSPETAIELLGDDAIGLRFTQPVPYPLAPRRGSATEYIQLVKRFSTEKPTFVGMEGFLTAKLMVKALEMTPQLDRAKLIATLESMKNVPLTEDFRVTYGPNDRTGSTFVDTLMIGSQRKILR